MLAVAFGERIALHFAKEGNARVRATDSEGESGEDTRRGQGIL
jgi:hypothetical protein|tara:strand:+ start:972 stop:1100 length:129 start_codon:yes stop_codon:yes gene_type:complete